MGASYSNGRFCGFKDFNPFIIALLIPILPKSDTIFCREILPYDYFNSNNLLLEQNAIVRIGQKKHFALSFEKTPILITNNEI